MRFAHAVAVVVALIALAGQASAVMVDPYVTQDGREIEIEYWTGSGTNQSALLVDFRQEADDAFAFGYLWDPAGSTPTAKQMIEDIAAAGALETDLTEFAFGFSVDRLRYDDGGGVMETADYPAYFIDGDPGDPPQEGLDWALPGLGISARDLVDRSFDGFVHAVFPDDYEGFDYVGPAPRIPLAEVGGDVIPEPTTLALLGLGALPLLRRRRR